MRQTSKSLLLAGIAAFATLLLARNIDFRVYWYGVHGFFSGSRPAYGPHSGLGFPMHYRYAPVTYLLLWPLTQLPLQTAGILWLSGAWAVAIAVVRMTVRTARLRFTRTGILAAIAFLTAYVVLSLRSGNVQTYIISMILAALVWSESRPRLAAALLAIAITFKLWPLFFVPWFLRPERRPVLTWLVPACLLLWFAPLLVWSPSHYGELILEWCRSEFQWATTAAELWYFPGQSLRGLLLRYFTANEPWIEGFPKVQILRLDPAQVVRAWQGVAVTFYLAVCVAMLRSGPQERRLWDAASFALFTVLQPFCVKSSMISLGPSILLAAARYSVRTGFRCWRETLARRLFLAACSVALLGAAMQYKPWLRLLLAWGLDFYAALLLTVALLLWTKLGDDYGNSSSSAATARRSPCPPPTRSVRNEAPLGPLTTDM